MPTETIDYNYKSYRDDLYVWDLPKLQDIQNPGVYILKDKNNKIIYIGEASNLYARVKSHINGETLELGAKKVGNIIKYRVKDEYKYIYKIALYIFDVKHQYDRYYLEIKLIREENPVFNYEYRTNFSNQKPREQYKRNKRFYIDQNIGLRREKWNKFQQRAIENGNTYTSDKELVNALPKNVEPLRLSVLQRVENICNHLFEQDKMLLIVNKQYQELIDMIIKDPSLKYKDEDEILEEAFKIGFCVTGTEENDILKLIPERIRNYNS